MSEEIKKFFTTYTDFVTKVTSNPSIELDALKESFDQIEKKITKKNINLYIYCNISCCLDLFSYLNRVILESLLFLKLSVTLLYV